MCLLSYVKKLTERKLRTGRRLETSCLVINRNIDTFDKLEHSENVNSFRYCRITVYTIIVYIPCTIFH